MIKLTNHFIISKKKFNDRHRHIHKILFFLFLFFSRPIPSIVFFQKFNTYTDQTVDLEKS